jgi:hypothetical protein
MNTLSRDELKSLFGDHRGLCVSIYLPTHRTMPDVLQDPIRLKNLIKRAETLLAEHGIRPSDASTLLEPARMLLDNSHYWEYQRDGLALFLADGFFRSYSLPMTFAESVVVSHAFVLNPLLRFFTNDGHFFLLTLSQHGTTLYSGSQQGLASVPVEQMPKNLDDALKYDVVEKQLQFRSGVSSTGTGAIFHGQGVGIDDAKDRILRYFRAVDKSLQPTLRGHHAPLILAGVEYLFPIYREAATYRSLIEPAVKGNVDQMPLAELHRQAWEIAHKHFKQVQETAAGLYRKLAAEPKTSGSLQDTLMAAEYGRVEYLFVPVGVEYWGTFDRGRKSIELHDRKQNGDVDLLDLAAQFTIMNNGTVFAVPLTEMPDQTPVAAVYRY